MMRRTARRTTRDRGSLNLETVPLLVIMVMMVAIGLAMLGLAITEKAGGTATAASPSSTAEQPAETVEQPATPPKPMSAETKQLLLSTGGIGLALVLASFGGRLLSRGYKAARKRREAASGFVPAEKLEQAES